ncbi:MAG: hypothetical protein PHU12_01075 [Candidatus Aenigmarchaeota archaeon]|nr:hypothetical protein [Candidatus Aenigmarchaeota archaeon]
MKNENKVMFGYILYGILVGAASYYMKNVIASLLTMLMILYIGKFTLGKIFKITEKFKWFLTNGGWMYIFVWFIVWTILINVIR